MPRPRTGEPQAPAGEPDEGRSAGAPEDRYGWFVLGVGSWFGAWGMQSVLFSWLVVGELRAGAEWVGTVQMTAMLPSLLLLLVGGAIADRVDARRLLQALHLVAALPVVALALVLPTGRLSLPLLFAYGASVGTIAAFALPARDVLLSRVAGPDMMRAVTGMTAAQFGAQALGSLVAGAAGAFGVAPMLLLQGLVLALGAWAVYRLPHRERVRLAPSRPGRFTDGVRFVLGSPRLRGPTILQIAVGLLFIGPFLVTFPLLVRDHYRGGVTDLSVLLMLFPLGTIAGSLVLRARGGVRHKGRALLGALAVGATALASMSVGLPFAGLLLATLIWGMGGAVFINTARTLYQESAPRALRGRILAVFQLCFIGAGPLGALAAGFVNGWVGPLLTLRVFAGAMLLLVAAVALRSEVLRIE